MKDVLQTEVWRKTRLLEQAERMAHIGVWDVDVESGTVSLSDEARRIHEVGPGDVLRIDEIATFFPQPDYAARPDLCAATIATGHGIEVQGEILTARGNRRFVHRIVEPEMRDGRIVRIFGIIRDLTEQREQEQALWRVAHYDALTNVPNRHYWTIRLNEAVARARRQAGQLTMLMFDLDGFKEINDTRGHATGDALLVQLGQRLAATLPCDAFHARLGGDEFAILLEGDAREINPEPLARDILAAIQKPMFVGALRLQISGTFGSASFPRDAQSAADLMRKADIALYQAKRVHRSSFVSFRSEIGDLFSEKRAAIDLLAQAIDQQRLVPFYQRKVDMRSGKRVGFEALCRVIAEDGTLIEPAHFMPALQEPASAARLGAAMLELVTRDIADWRAAGLKPLPIALNVTSADFAKAPLNDRIQSRLAALRLHPSDLEIEVTENTILGKEAEMVSEMLRVMQDAGIGITLDDFGTGYASLTHLRDAPITCLKLDRSFIAGLGRGAESAIIVRSVVDLGHSLGMRVVAEGVETSGQAEFLRSIGCDEAQGFLFGRPAPRAETRALLEAEAARGRPLANAADRNRTA